MSSWIVLDWDQEQFHVAVAQTTRRGVQISHAVTWAHPEPLTASSAERVGKALREFFKTAKIAPAPVLVGLGRDRIFLKELRFPPIAAHEEASLVRFQTGKEMAESVESYAIDYVHLQNGNADRHVMTVAVRRDIVASLQTLSQSAGLKLHAVTPKLFGMALALDRAVRPDPTPLGPKQLSVVLNIGTRWAELCFFRGHRLLQAQSLANGPLLASEVKRSLAVFSAQSAVSLDLDAPECLYAFGDDKAALDQLQTGQPLPVRILDPLKADAEGPEHPAHFAGAAGLAVLWSDPEQRPVNLAAPKRSSAPTTALRQRGYLYGSVAAVAAIFLIGMMMYVLAAKRGEITRLEDEKIALDKAWTEAGQVRAELDAYKEWEQTTIPWLDELYDLSARFPYEKDFRVNTLGANPAGGVGGKKGPAKDNYVGKLTFTAVARAGDDGLVDKLRKEMMADHHLKAETGNLGATATWFNYDMKIDVAKQDALKYTTQLQKPERKVVTVYKTLPPKVIEPPEEMKKDDTDPPDDPDQEGGQR